MESGDVVLGLVEWLATAASPSPIDAGLPRGPMAIIAMAATTATKAPKPISLLSFTFLPSSLVPYI
jgi:hypothetical protein